MIKVIYKLSLGLVFILLSGGTALAASGLTLDEIRAQVEQSPNGYLAFQFGGSESYVVAIIRDPTTSSGIRILKKEQQENLFFENYDDFTVSPEGYFESDNFRFRIENKTLKFESLNYAAKQWSSLQEGVPTTLTDAEYFTTLIDSGPGYPFGPFNRLVEDGASVGNYNLSKSIHGYLRNDLFNGVLKYTEKHWSKSVNPDDFMRSILNESPVGYVSYINPKDSQFVFFIIKDSQTPEGFRFYLKSNDVPLENVVVEYSADFNHSSRIGGGQFREYQLKIEKNQIIFSSVIKKNSPFSNAYSFTVELAPDGEERFYSSVIYDDDPFEPSHVLLSDLVKSLTSVSLRCTKSLQAGH